MPRECGEIAQERRAGEMKRKIAAKRESAHRKPQRKRSEEPERLEQRHSRKEGGQPAGTDRGRKPEPERIREADTERRRDSESAQPESRRGCRADDQQTQTANAEPERFRAGNVAVILGRSSAYLPAMPSRITSKNQSEAGEAKEKRRAYGIMLEYGKSQQYKKCATSALLGM